MYQPSKDPDQINSIINNQPRKSFVAGYDGSFIDCRHVIESGMMFFVSDKQDSGAVVIPDDLGGAEVHVFAKIGAAVKSLVRMCKALAFDLDYEPIYSYIPAEDGVGQKIARLSGMVEGGEFARDLGFGVPQHVKYYEVRKCLQQ